MEAELDKYAKAIDFAIVATLNDQAFASRTFARQNLRDQMTLRNKWTVGSVRVERAKLSDPEAATGAIDSYLYKQEFGGSEQAKGVGVPLPTSFGSGEGDNAIPRTRLPRRANRLPNISITKLNARGSRKRRNAIKVSHAARTGRKFVYLDLARRKGIFKITGGKRNPRPKMLFDLSSRSTRTPPNPWLLPATKRAFALTDKMYLKNIEKQIKITRAF